MRVNVRMYPYFILSTTTIRFVLITNFTFMAGCTFDFDLDGLNYPDSDTGKPVDVSNDANNVVTNDGSKLIGDAANGGLADTIDVDTPHCDLDCDIRIPRCTSGETRCSINDSFRVEQCNDSGTWISLPCPSGSICKSGACTRLSCLPNSLQCDPLREDIVLTCDSEGTWQVEEVCQAPSICSDGLCVPPADPCSETPGTCLDTQWFPCDSTNADDSIACVLSPCTVSGCAPVARTCSTDPNQNVCLKGDLRGIYRCTQDQNSALKIADCPPFNICMNGECVWPSCSENQPNACVADGRLLRCSEGGLTLTQTECPDTQICIPTQSASCISSCIALPAEKFCSGNLAISCPTTPGTGKITQCESTLSCDAGECKDLLLFENAPKGKQLTRDIYATRLSNPDQPWLVAGLPEVDESQPVFVPALSVFAYFFDEVMENKSRKIAFRPLSDLAGSNTPPHPRFLSELPLADQQKFAISADGQWLALGVIVPFSGPRIGLRPLLGGTALSIPTTFYSDHTAPHFHPTGSLIYLTPSVAGILAVRSDPQDPLATPEVLTQITHAVDVVLSPDEKLLAYVVGPTVQNDSQLWLFSLADLVHYQVPGMTEAKDPAFSADSGWLYFAGKAVEGGKDLDLFRLPLPIKSKLTLSDPQLFLQLPGNQTSPALVNPPMLK
ncbi:MAG: hypothetical protein HUU55_13660 [Myxococcales bacterium]|nr:hypothetical protein [Myxococcales bacterium]